MKYCKDYPALSVDERLKYQKWNRYTKRGLLAMAVSAVYAAIAGLVFSAPLYCTFFVFLCIGIAIPFVIISQWSEGEASRLLRKIDEGAGSNGEEYF
jgi:hypothetical protein